MPRLNHVALTVSDREASARFYGEYFGLIRRVHDDEHLLILADDSGGLLALSVGEVPPELPRTNHFGSLVGSAAEIDAMRDRFRADGVTETEYSADGPARVQVLDPDGYRVELYAY
ncbi:VOC family protein [Paracoccus sediminicola]|uniref:VOC family protein n=1 Tax=Paracoccus sediminicola TaxID=3017783 RepID=UPI0022EFE643|nr:VOC family protein [Paracoccus sediminicola]WBU55601.1 VOC family protein [Paracoccus sediminicola]